MCHRGRLLLLVSLAGSFGAASAWAQDSVSTTSGLPGDALSPYNTGSLSGQRRDYVVDLTTKSSSWGNKYQFGPLAKSSLSTANPNPQFFNHLIGAQAVSNRFTGIQNLLRPSYQAWAISGQGVNSTRNATPSDNGSGLYGTLDATQTLGQSFGFAFMEFGGGWNTTFGDNDDENNIIAGVAAFTPRNNSRVYVSRVTAATNRAGALQTTPSNASFGLGGVDEAGNVHFYADGFNMSAGDDPITNRRLVRVDSSLRSTSQNNQIRGSGPIDTTATRTVVSTSTNLTTPTLIPKSISGRAVLIAADMANNFIYEQSAGSTASTTSYLPAGASARGPISYTVSPFARVSNGTADAGTCAVLSRGPSATKTRGLSAWGVNADGSVDGNLRIDLPVFSGDIVDPVDGFNPATAFGSLGNQEFMNYQSQVCFRGGNGPVALTVLPGSGDLLMAAGVAATGGGATVPQSMDNYIAVARVNAGTGAVSWSIAAHTGNAAGAAGGQSKAIMGDVGGVLSPIGVLAKYNEAYPGASSGPSISAPAMDRFGNIYFVATIQLSTLPQPTQTVALLRANFNPSDNGYQLELLVQLNDVIAGRNSTRNYQVQFLSPADGDSVDSGATWAGNVVQDTSAAVSVPNVGYGSPAALGALVFRTKIVYDMNNDGVYLDPSGPGGSGSPDQAYNVVMVMTPKIAGADIVQIGGAPGPDGQVTGDDFIAFINAFSVGDTLADVCAIGGQPFPDGQVTGDDFIFFINEFAAGG